MTATATRRWRTSTRTKEGKSPIVTRASPRPARLGTCPASMERLKGPTSRTACTLPSSQKQKKKKKSQKRKTFVVRKITNVLTQVRTNTSRFHDMYTSLAEGIGAFVGNRSVVIHFANTTRFACSNFVAVYPDRHKADEKHRPMNKDNMTPHARRMLSFMKALRGV